MYTYRDRAHGATSARFRWQWITAGDRADGLPAIEPAAGLTSARGAAVWMPGCSLRVGLVQMVHARGATAANLRTGTEIHRYFVARSSNYYIYRVKT